MKTEPNPLTPFPSREGGMFKASLLVGERFGERFFTGLISSVAGIFTSNSQFPPNAALPVFVVEALMVAVVI